MTPATPPDADAREIAKWLNEEADRMIDGAFERSPMAFQAISAKAEKLKQAAALLSAIPGEATEEDVRAVFAKLGLVSAATLTDVLRQHGLIITRAPKETK